MGVDPTKFGRKSTPLGTRVKDSHRSGRKACLLGYYPFSNMAYAK